MPLPRAAAEVRAALLLLPLALPVVPAAAQPAPAQPGQAQPGQAQPGQAQTAQARAADAREAWRAAVQAATHGPASVPLLDQAALRLPAGMIFIPKAESARLWSAWGNRPNPGLLGTVTTLNDDDHWSVLVSFTGEGYVRDDEAKGWNADGLLAGLREGTEEANKERARRGFPELELTGWIEPPSYDAARHRLVWALGVKHKGESDAEGSVNLNTRALGRDGYFSLNLVTDPDRLGADRPVAARLLANLDYVDGKRYEDFNASTDRVAEYGLAALLGVAAAKKFGLLALAGAFLAKFAKLGALALAGLGAGAVRLFRRKPSA